jgi:hypothetical protein
VTNLLFSTLALPWMPWLLAGLIVGAALLIWLDFRWRRAAVVLTALDEAIAAVEESEGPGTFRRRFPSIFQRLASNAVLGEAWRAYAPTVTAAPGQEDALGYTRRPQESFNEGLLATAGINLRFYNAVPNFLVGTGLLFTFLGLVAALYFASRGVAAAEIEEAQHALRELLSAATFKFVTSIAGLASSMLFSWREKAVLHEIHKRLARLCAAIEERMVPVTAESIGIAQLAELRQQQSELQRLGRSLLVKVPQGVEERIAEELVDALRPLRAATQALAGRLARSDEWLLQVVLEAAEAGARESGEPAGTRAVAVLDRLGELVTAVRDTEPRMEGPPLPAPDIGAEPVPALVGRARAVVSSLDARLGDALLRIRDLLRRTAAGRRPSRDDLEAASGLLLEAQGSLQQAKAATGRLAQRLELLATASRGEDGEEALLDGLQDELATLSLELRQTMRLLEAGAGGAQERLAQATGRLTMRQAG